MTNQVEFHPRLAQSKLRAFCADRDIVLTGYSPFGAPHGNWERPEKVKGMLEEPTLRDVAEKHGKSVPQVILRWMVSACGLLDTVPRFFFVFFLSEHLWVTLLPNEV